MASKTPEERAAEARLREAEDAGCYGLVRGIARNLETDEEWEAETAYKLDGPFYCPTCFSDVVLRKCSEKVDHFAHKARLSPVLGALETSLHRACKEEICALLKERHPDGKWEVERAIPERKAEKIPMLRPDISGRINDQRIAIEVQASALTIPRIVHRTTAYAKRKIALLWIVPLREPLGNLPFRPRLYERYFHSIYFGRTYYWCAGQGLSVTPVHYGPASRHIEYREWREDGEDKSSGGYDAQYKTIRTPMYGLGLDLSEDFGWADRSAFTPDNERKEVPACRIWRDTHPEWW